MMGNPLTQDGIKGLVKKLRKRGDELPNPEYNPDSVMLYQAARALEAQEWRGIESAPKDGSNVLLWCPRPKTELPPFQITGYWDTEINYDGHQWVSTTHDNIYQPTHWKPLTPPETE